MSAAPPRPGPGAASPHLARRLLDLAAAHPDRPAIVSRDGGVLSYGGLAERALGLAGTLAARGLAAGDRVLLLVPVSPDLYVTLAALWWIGAVAVVIDPSAGLGHLRRALDLVRPAGVVGVPAGFLLGLAAPELRRVPVLVRLPAAPSAPPPPADLAPDAPALITFTSGSTGAPKAAVRSHAFLLAQHAALERALDLRAGTLDLTTLPIVALANLASGVTCLLPDVSLRRPAEVDANALLWQLRRRRPDSTAASPALLERLAEVAVEQREELPFARIFAGGGPVFPRALDLLARAAPRAEIVSVYGSTEAEPIAHWPHRLTTPEDLGRMAAGGGLLAGPPVADIALRVLPDRWGGPLPYTAEADLHADALGADRPGEIVVAGDHVLPGYLGGVGDAETKWRDPQGGRVWHRTGDAGYLDADGRLWLLGRCAAKVVDARGPLYPFAVEVAAHGHPGVERAALLGVGGRRVLAVQWRAPRRERDEAGLRARLEWAALDEVRAVRALPVDRRHGAKIDYGRLARLLRQKT